MAAAIFLSLLLHALCTTAVAQQGEGESNIISLGSSLTPNTNSSWLSRSGLYAFGFYRQGNGFAVGVFLAGIPEQTVVWTANRDDPPVPSSVTLMLTSDGRLVLQSTQGQDINNIANNLQPASSASMLDSGNFVIYNSNQMIIWESFDHPTDTLLPGQILQTGEQLFSSGSETDHSTGIFRLIMQFDGNLVQYPVNSPNGPVYAYWSTLTGGVGANVTLHLSDNGRLYLLNSSSSLTLMNITEGYSYSTQGKVLYLAKIDVDGIFRLYSRDLNQTGGKFSTVWSSTNNKCDPKGLCGPNAYCVLLDNQAECICIPGFDSINPGNWSLGCERNFTAEGCKDENGKVVIYAMRELENIWWEDISYSTLMSLSKEDCEKACLEDCNCEAALFGNGDCRMQRIPLSYARRLLSDSTIAFIKVGTSSSTPTLKDHLPIEREKEIRVDILIVSVSFIVIAFLVLIIAGVLIYRNHAYAYGKITETGRNVELYEDIAPQAFTYAELEQVTDGFKEEVGKGAFGTVYKGTIMKNHKVVAVKRLDKVLAEGEKEFQTEMKVIGKTHHRNLVRLLGYCVDGPKRLLVYKFMSNGSLADLLFSTSSEKKPYWDERISIALDIARGILYLHEECETQIIHCDIKPQNILMDEYRCAKIADFGLAKLLKQDQTNTFTGIRGTRGYVAPEWHRKLPVTVKADVYSYGIVLFEIICCRRSVDWSLSEEKTVLEEWVYECFQAGEVGKLVGDEEVDIKKLERMVRVGLWCIQDELSLRPSMKKVLLMLEGTVDIPIPPSPTSFFSTT